MEHPYHDHLNKDDCLVPDEHVRGKKTKKDYYSNSEQGLTIINAVSGKPYYGYKVGSKDEHQFWRVMIPVTDSNMTTTAKLFYDSPEEYEHHRNVELDDNIKRTWRNKLNSNKVIKTDMEQREYTTVR